MFRELPDSIVEECTYNPDTGVLAHPKYKQYKNTKGALQLSTPEGLILVHRLIWRIMTGKWPAKQIDHIDVDNTNNRWANLREADDSQNGANKRMYKCNKVGWKGVSKATRNPKIFVAQIKKNGKVKMLGTFKCPTKAHLAYRAAARELHGEYARA